MHSFLATPDPERSNALADQNGEESDKCKALEGKYRTACLVTWQKYFDLQHKKLKALGKNWESPNVSFLSLLSAAFSHTLDLLTEGGLSLAATVNSRRIRRTGKLTMSDHHSLQRKIFDCIYLCIRRFCL